MIRLGLKAGNKFGLLIVCGLNASFPDEGNTGSFRVKALSELEYDDMFNDYLGKRISERLRERKNLIFIIETPSNDLNVLDDENYRIMQKLEALRKALLIACNASYINCVFNTGSVFDNDHINIRQQMVTQNVYHLGNRFTISKNDLDIIDKLFQAIGHLDNLHKDYYSILRYGLYCLLHAPENYFVEEVLHQYVRALEAIVHCFGTRQFAERVITLCDDQAQPHKDYFKEIRQMRNDIEHLKSPPELDCKRAALFMKFFANRVFQNVLLDGKILAQHETTDILDDLWERNGYFFQPQIDIKQIKFSVDEVFEKRKN